MRDYDELGVRRHRDHFAGEAPDVRFIQRRVDFVKQTEGRGTIMKYSEDQRQSGHRLFAAREQQNVLQALARRLRDDVDARFQFVVRVDQYGRYAGGHRRDGPDSL